MNYKYIPTPEPPTIAKKQVGTGRASGGLYRASPTRGFGGSATPSSGSGSSHVVLTKEKDLENYIWDAKLNIPLDQAKKKLNPKDRRVSTDSTPLHINNNNNNNNNSNDNNPSQYSMMKNKSILKKSNSSADVPSSSSSDITNTPRNTNNSNNLVSFSTNPSSLSNNSSNVNNNNNNNVNNANMKPHLSYTSPAFIPSSSNSPSVYSKNTNLNNNSNNNNYDNNNINSLTSRKRRKKYVWDPNSP
jgi:hypothetical protein